MRLLLAIAAALPCKQPPSPKFRLRVLTAALLLGGLGLASEVGAEDLVFQGIEVVRHQPMYVNNVGEWGAYLVTLRNNGESTRSLSVVLQIQSNYGEARDAQIEWNIELSPGATKGSMLPIFAGSHHGRGQLEIYEKGKLLTPPRNFALAFNLQPANNGQTSQNFLLVVGSGNWDFSRVESSFRVRFPQANSEFHKVRPDDLPTQIEVYDNIQHIVLFGVDPEAVGTARAEVLRRAIRGGRQGWIVPDKGGIGVSWISELNTEHPKEVREIQIKGRSHSILEWQNDPGKVETTVTGEATQWSYPEGLGCWNRLAAPEFDQDTIVGRALPDMEFFHPRPTNYNSWGYGGSQRSGWQRALDSMVREHVPLPTVFGILLAYLILIGPGLFWYLRKKGRLILLLWLQPVVVVAFVGIVYVIGWAHFGALSSGQETLVIYQPQYQTWGFAYSVHTQYNPVSGEFDLKTDDGTLPVPMTRERQNHWVVGGASASKLQDFFLPTWSHTHVVSAGAINLEGSVEVRRTQTTWEIVNNTPYTLKSPYWGDGLLVDIRPGESLSIDVNVSPQDRARFAGWSNSLYRLQSEVRDAFPNRKSIIVFQLDAAELPEQPFSIVGEKRARNVLLVAGSERQR